MKVRSLIILLLTSTITMAQPTDTTFLEKLMKTKPEQFLKLLNHPEKNQIQVLYTAIKRDKHNNATFKLYSYNLDDHRYFYPASTVKLAGVIFAIEKINTLKIKDLSISSTMITESSYPGQTEVNVDTSTKSGLPSIEYYIKKILLTSDNDAFNRLFEFVGRAEMNRKLKANGLLNSRIINRLAIGDAGEPSKHTNGIKFYKGKRLVYAQEPQYDPLEYELNLYNTSMGKGYMDSTDHLVNKPFNLVNKNAFSISDQQFLLKKLMMPEAFPIKERFNLKDSDYKLIYKFMSMYPTESTEPRYNPEEFWSTYAKMIFYGRDKHIDNEQDIRIFNKYGDSYGYIIDNAYFVDFKNNIEFFLTAVVQSNEDGIYNDNKYEYETVCFPFMRNLGQLIHQNELSQKKDNLPDLKKYRMKYK
jgi:hypothetical protein